MPAEQIPRGEWREFFDSFSRQHEGWLTRTELGDRLLSNDLPLIGIAADRAAIEIMLGGTTYVIDRPARVIFERTRTGAHAGVRIETAGGEVYALQFRVAAHPEFLDGIQE